MGRDQISGEDPKVKFQVFHLFIAHSLFQMILC